MYQVLHHYIIEMKKKKLEKINIGKILIIAFQAAPVNFMLAMLDTFISITIPTLQIICTAQFINTITEIVNNNLARSAVYHSLFILILLVILVNTKDAIFALNYLKLELAISEKVQTRIVKKKATLSYWHIENNDTWEMISRVTHDACNRLIVAFKNLTQCINIVLSVLLVLGALFIKVWWAAIIILICFVPLFFICLKCGKADWTGFEEANKNNRRSDYLRSILYQRECEEEKAIFQYTDQINKEWNEKFRKASKVEIKVFARNSINVNVAGIITILVFFTIAYFLLMLLGEGKLSIGLFVGFVLQLFSLIRTISKDLTDIMIKLASDNEYMNEYERFMELSVQKGADEQPTEESEILKEHTIQFKHVSFKYPQTDKWVLRDFSVTFNKGVHYALVGMNGAGKSTIVKLLTGLYEDYEGEILVDGKNLKEYTQSQIKGLFSIVYQDFAKYEISLSDSILLGDVNDMSNTDKVQKAIKEVGLEMVVEKLENGIKSPIGKIIEGGVDLSGGEWQRIAIARGVISKAPIRILDEPTAALDPVAESNIYELFSEISKGKTTILITHRLGAAKLADEIILIDEGKVVEQGSHETLMKMDGLYANMFESQRSWYK